MLVTTRMSAWRSTCGCNPPPAPTCSQRGAVAIAPAVDIEPVHSTRLWTAPAGCARCPPLPASCAPAVDSYAAHTRACPTRVEKREVARSRLRRDLPRGRRERGRERGQGFTLPRQAQLVTLPSEPGRRSVGRSHRAQGPAGALRRPRSRVCPALSLVAASRPLSGARKGVRSSAVRAACASRESGLGGQVEKGPRLIDVQHTKPGART